ncbi:hypothetical protein ACFVDQ_32715 [Streptomyces sp. NPDC057684]|uniref:hypothetical protein n=1 Tax=Streptomyces sp. NPDC057684 TaxID=3346211 RepID=UPI003699BB32
MRPHAIARAGGVEDASEDHGRGGHGKAGVAGGELASPEVLAVSELVALDDDVPGLDDLLRGRAVPVLGRGALAEGHVGERRRALGVVIEAPEMDEASHRHRDRVDDLGAAALEVAAGQGPGERGEPGLSPSTGELGEARPFSRVITHCESLPLSLQPLGQLG